MKRKGNCDDHTSTHWHGNRFAPPLQIVLVITRRSPSPPYPHDSAGRAVASSSFRRRFVYIPRDFEFVPDSSDMIIWTRGVLPWPVLTRTRTQNQEECRCRRGHWTRTGRVGLPNSTTLTLITGMSSSSLSRASQRQIRARRVLC